MEYEDYYETNEPLVGSKLPDVEFETYQDEKIEKVKLSDYKGKWLILFFYPADFTFICPTELEEMADNYEAFKKEMGSERISALRAGEMVSRRTPAALGDVIDLA